MWSFLRGKKRAEKRAESPAEPTTRRDDALSALAAERREVAAQRERENAQADETERAERTGRAARKGPRGETAADVPHSDVDVVLDPHAEDVGAGIAPEQDEAELLAPRLADRPLTREDRVADALDRWAQQIAGDDTAPSFLTQIRGAGVVLDLTHSHPSGLAQLLAGRGPTRLSSLVREVGALADARAHARTIREIAERHAEEVGLTTCHLGIGEAIWHPADGSEPIHAPVLVRPITLRLRGNAREDVDLEVDATADLNPVLLRALRDSGVAVDARALLGTTDGPHGFDPTPVLDAFRSLGQPLPGFTIRHALVVGNLMDAAGSVAADLAHDQEDWAASDLIAALAGDAEATAALREKREQAQVETVPEEELVAAVDPEHRSVLEQVLTGQDLAVPVAPGTTGLDLVVDLAAELNARGRSVLIVSQRRRNLAQLVRTAQERDLDELVFDLSPDPSLQRNASAALLRSLRRAGTHGLTDADAAPAELTESRDILVGHVEAMHRQQEPWGASAHEAISALAALTRLHPAPRTAVRLPADVAASMVGSERERYAASLREAAEVGVLTAGPETSAWYGAPISSDTQAARAEELVDQLHEETLPRLRRACAAAGSELGLAEPTTLEQLQRRLRLLDRVQGLLATFQPAVFSAPVADFVAATADKQWREEHGATMGFGTRRRLRKQAQALQRPAALSPDLHRDLLEVRAVDAQWREATAPAPGERSSRPCIPKDLEAVHRAAQNTQRILDELAVLLDGTEMGTDLASTELEELERRTAALRDTREDLATLPRRTELLRRLSFDGLGELVEDLRSRRVPREQVSDELELAWWRSVLELIAGAEPTLSQYDGTSLSQVAERFRRLDAEYLAASSARVHAAADETRVATMKAYPDTSRAAIAELARSSTVSIRDLAAKYEDILFAARPAWLASPYLVPQVIPRGRHFDVVIVADGGRLPTAAALPSIVRGTQTIVVGDVLEYGGEESASVLEDMLRIAPHHEVRRDPHPATEGMRAFAQRRGLVGPVRTVPSPVGLEQDRLLVVEDARGPVTEGRDYVESTEAELRRVTDLVIEHARTRPERSLAVLTITEPHARRLMERIMHTVAVIPALREFFDPAATEPFVVVPAAQAAAVTRDDVIISLGFGKTPHGRVLHNFGPLSSPSGRKALATVITRARGRTTLVSGLAVQELDHARLRTDGARDLRALLWVLQGGADVPVVPQVAQLSGEDTEVAPPVVEEATPAPEDEEPTGTEPEAVDDPAAGSEPAEAPDAMSDADLDAAIDAVLARKTAGPVAEDADEGEAAEEPADADAAQPAAEPVADAAPTSDPEPAPTEDSAPRPLETDALVHDLADRLARLGLLIERDFGTGEDRIELALGHPDLPGRLLLAVDTDGDHYVATPSQRERDRLRAQRLEEAGWATERVWSWALFIDPDGEAERIRRALDRALRLVEAEESTSSPSGVGTIRHRLPRPQIPAGHPLSFYSSEDFDAVVEYICSDGRARLEEHLATEVRAFLGFEQRSVLLDVSVSSAIRRYQERQ